MAVSALHHSSPSARLNRQYPALAGVANLFLIAGQPTGQLALHGLPGLLALSQFAFGNQDVQPTVREVNAHAISVTEKPDRPAFLNRVDWCR